MRRAYLSEGAMKAFQRGLLPGLLFWATTTACNNTCFSFHSNPSASTIVISSPTCKFSKANGVVSLQLSSSPMPAAGGGPRSVQHIFVSLRGIEADPMVIGAGDSAGWQELAPHLVKQPVQVDLMARTPETCAPGSLGEATIPADVYSQIRLRLVPTRPAANEPVPEENVCGSAGFNCVVTADGGTQPLLLDGVAPELRITPERIAGGFFRVLPDAHIRLAIEFDIESSVIAPAREAAQLVPRFSAASRSLCDSTASSEEQ